MWCSPSHACCMHAYGALPVYGTAPPPRCTAAWSASRQVMVGRGRIKAPSHMILSGLLDSRPYAHLTSMRTGVHTCTHPAAPPPPPLPSRGCCRAGVPDGLGQAHRCLATPEPTRCRPRICVTTTDPAICKGHTYQAAMHITAGNTEYSSSWKQVWAPAPPPVPSSSSFLWRSQYHKVASDMGGSDPLVIFSLVWNSLAEPGSSARHMAYRHMACVTMSSGVGLQTGSRLWKSRLNLPRRPVLSARCHPHHDNALVCISGPDLTWTQVACSLVSAWHPPAVTVGSLPIFSPTRRPEILVCANFRARAGWEPKSELFFFFTFRPL